jgi:putative Mg2+ transporter-C (MgtC) family protein
MILRMLVSVAAGMILGRERKLRNKPAGSRTHVLVCLTATIISIISAYGYAEFEGMRTMDPARLTTGILTGVGFIGAGIIWKDGGDIRGITTAANIFLTACLGIAIGIGQYVLTACAVALAVITLEMSVFFARRQNKRSGDDSPVTEEKAPKDGY